MKHQSNSEVWWNLMISVLKAIIWNHFLIQDFKQAFMKIKADKTVTNLSKVSAILNEFSNIIFTLGK